MQDRNANITCCFQRFDSPLRCTTRVDADNSTPLFAAFPKHCMENPLLEFERLPESRRPVEPYLANKSSTLDTCDQYIQFGSLGLDNLRMKTESDVYVL